METPKATPTGQGTWSGEAEKPAEPTTEPMVAMVPPMAGKVEQDQRLAGSSVELAKSD